MRDNRAEKVEDAIFEEDEVLFEFKVKESDNIPEHFKAHDSLQRISNLAIIKVADSKRHYTAMNYLVLGKINGEWTRLHGDVSLIIIPYFLELLKDNKVVNINKIDNANFLNHG
jgi:hypothetical protein